MPIFRAAGEEGTEREFIAARLVYVNTRQITPAGLLNFDLGHLLLGDCGTGGAGLLGESVEEDLIT